MERLAALFSEHSFMPHGHCYLWTPALVWIQVLTNGLIGLSYVAISLTLLGFMRRVRELPLRSIYVAFGSFIVACGFTHFMDVWVIWQPHYWLDAGVRLVTAAASLATALLLPRVVPKAVMLLQGTERMRREGVALEKAIADLSTLYQRTRELDQRKTDFFANVSHELRTPLTLILAPVEELLRRQDLPKDVSPQLEAVRRNARSLLRHVNDLLDVQKLDARKLLPVYSSVDLAQLVRGTAAQFDSIARERCIRLSLDVPAELACETDEEQVLRIFLNLLSNAFKFTPPGGAIAVRLATLPDQARGMLAVLRVEDSGPGVPLEERQKIFERFGQGTSTGRERAFGSGLGLAIVRELVELHGGKVTVEETPLGGAAFEARWPVSAPAWAPVHSARMSSQKTASAPCQAALDVARDLADTSSALSPDEDASGGEQDRPTLVLAEDSADLRHLLVSTLGTRYRVLAARDGEEALALVRRRTPDLILSDLMMPKLTGEELVVRVRAIPSLDGVPILLLTAKADEELRARILRSGAQDFLLKPFEREELLARVQNLVAIRRTYLLLRSEVEAKQGDIEALSREVIDQKRKLEVTLASMKLAREAAEQASRQKSDFLSLVSHELRTPLTSLRLQVARLERGRVGTLSELQSDAVAKIARSSGRLFDMVESLLQFSRLETGHIALTNETLDVVAIAREVLEELRLHAEEKNLSLRVEATSESVTLNSDPHLVRLIIVNLCDNAIKYTSSGQVVVSIAREESGGVRISVSDTGPGIAKSAQERVFLPFEQLENVRHKQGSGVGLGLALVKRVADALRAELTLQSEPGVGSTFSVTFRRAKGDCAA